MNEAVTLDHSLHLHPSPAAADLSRHGAVLVDPPAANWRELIAGSWERARRDPVAMQTRRELGLAVDRPVVMSGHQAVFWHPGILAKWLAAQGAAREMNAGAAWVVVDHDSDDAGEVAYPRVPRSGVVERAAWRWAPGNAAEVPGVLRPAVTLDEKHVPADSGVEAINLSLRRAGEALRASADEKTLAGQVTAATARMLDGEAPGMVWASRLAQTEALGGWIAAMEREPEMCVLGYNAAVRAHPDSGLRELSADDINDRWELPLWRLEAGKARAKVFAEDLHGIPRAELAPRAILMTAFLRRYACDLFIHGLGGGIYDRACDDWMGRWMPGQALARTVVVSATLHLPLGPARAASEGEIARAGWTVHSARHNPVHVGDQASQARKLELVGRINALPRRSPQRRGLYVQLHEQLEAVRAGHPRELAALREGLEVARRSVETAKVAGARDWPFFLYAPEAIEGVRREITAGMAGSR